MVSGLKKLLEITENITDRTLKTFQKFLDNPFSSSVLLLLASITAILWANSPFSDSYHSLWHTKLALKLNNYQISKELLHWINDGLMAMFFFALGLEIKREMLVGELASSRKSFLPISAAIGGMLFPALIFFIFNHGTPAIKGWGIPMATDVAFALGAIAVLGRRLPSSLKVFLVAFAIADDLGAVLIIAIFYTETIVIKYLMIALILLLCLALANLLWIRWALIYAVLGIVLWVVIFNSGIHSTVAGIVVAIFFPARGKYDTDRFIQNVSNSLGKFHCPPDGCGYSILKSEEHLNAVQSIEMACHDVETPLQRIENLIHPWVYFILIPIFAFANAGLTLKGINLSDSITSYLTLGIVFGLLIGKPLGMTLFSYLSVKMNMASLPSGVTWLHILGVSVLGGIGFTMSIFISFLSFPDPLMLNDAKIGITLGSSLSAIVGLGILGFACAFNPGSRSNRIKSL